MSELQEKCAVVGAIDEEAAQITVDALVQQVNRGRGSSGIGGITENGKMVLERQAGRADKIWTDDTRTRIGSLGIKAAIGQNRWATYGPQDRHHQPVETPQIYLAHNGNLSETNEINDFLVSRGIETQALNDSEMMGAAIAEHVKWGRRLDKAAAEVYPMLVGAFSVTALGKDENGQPMVVAFRDHYGVRPLTLGKTATGYMATSETRGLEAAGAEYIRDIQPGEMITITQHGYTSRQLAEPDPKFDAFELIYFQDPDSKFHGTPIREIREAFGHQLAAEHGRDVRPNSLVIGVPASAIPAAKAFARKLGLAYRQEAIAKNDEVGRSFIGATPAEREYLRDQKYRFQGKLVQDRDVVIIDDSIVRLNTAPYIVRTMKELGAKSVRFFAASPRILHPNYYGLDTGNQSELAAATNTVRDLKAKIGCERLGFLSVGGLVEALHKATGQPRTHFELSSFTGEYPIPIGNRQVRIINNTANAA